MTNKTTKRASAACIFYEAHLINDSFSTGEFPD